MKGFTLIEALVAVAIIAIAISAPLYTASRSMIVASNAKNQLVASYLAQEGIEYVRMMRDNEYLRQYVSGNPNASADAWSNNGNSGFLTGGLGDPNSIEPCISPGMCTLDPEAPLAQQIASCGLNQPCGPLYLDPDTQVYTQKIIADVQPFFTRSIQAAAVTPTDELITSTVTWNFHGSPYSVTTSDHLTPWQ
ncbi:prepilin-type N-terminal cleavage/methylation domain-containing protein [Patescibacteria group bacterium]|nr:prepilin-type N-terminal cleavage/methylation domain-containing protein [Patescibacteria group bacterium]